MATDEHPFDRIERLLRQRGAAVRQVRPGQIRARCPAHADRNASLAVGREPQRAKVYCFAHCKPIDILQALGLGWADLFTGPRVRPARQAIVAHYDYVDRDGVLVAQKVRFADPKGFRWRGPDTCRTGYRWGLDGVDLPPLYRCPELQGAALVFIVEGEKGVERLRALDLVATCGPAGVSTWKGTALLLESVATDATIAILPDNDRAGESHAERVAADLHEHRGDSAIVVKVVSLADLPPSGDVVDWLDGGRTPDELLAHVSSAPAWVPGAAEDRRRRHRRQAAAERKRRQRRMRIDAPRDRATDDRASKRALTLNAVLDELRRSGELSGRQLKAALAGRVPRDVVDEALKVGSEPGGALTCLPGPRSAKLYRPRTLNGAPDIHRVTDQSGHSSSVRNAEECPDTRSATCSEQNRVSECPVTLSRVTLGERSFCTLQEDSCSSLNTPRDIGPDTQSVTRAPDTEIGPKPGLVIPRFVARDPYRERDASEGPQVDYCEPSFVRGVGNGGSR